MDASTLHAYDCNAASYCDDWINQPPPADIHALWRRFFAPGGASADIGCGSGRDVDWLNRNGYPCVGFEPCDGLRNEARRRFPAWRYAAAALPDLDALRAQTFANVVCETVLMHLPRAAIRPAVRALARTLGSGGTLYLSWRVTDDCDVRDRAGRLYCAFPVDAVRDELAGLALLYDADEVSESSGRRVHRLIVRRPG
jgi:SAM-dependent methyltransferase